MLIIDTATFERALFSTGARGPMQDRTPGMSMSLPSLLTTLLPKKNSKPYPDVQAHNSGNDAFMSLLAMQMLLDPEGTKVPDVKKQQAPASRGQQMSMNLNGTGMGVGGMMVYPSPYMSMPNMAMMAGNGQISPQLSPGLNSQMQAQQQRVIAAKIGGGQISPGISSQSQSRSQSQQRPSSLRPRSGVQGGDGLSPPDEFGNTQSRGSSGTRNGRSPGRGPRVTGNGEDEGKTGVSVGSSATLGNMARKSAMALR